eukprot:COSAG01_NODE_17266_length_1165_cov_1.372420_2_plen_85_part_00
MSASSTRVSAQDALICRSPFGGDLRVHQQLSALLPSALHSPAASVEYPVERVVLLCQVPPVASKKKNKKTKKTKKENTARLMQS